MTALVILLAGTGVHQASAHGDACSRLADHADDVLAGESLYTDQSRGGRIDLVEAAFTRSGSDLMIELHVDDMHEPPIAGPVSSYHVAWWFDQGQDAYVDVVDNDGSWTFAARWSSDAFGMVTGLASGRPEPEVEGSVDEDAGLISVLVRDVLPAANLLDNVLIESLGSARDDRLSGGGIDRIHMEAIASVDLTADCTSPPDPLRAWCREFDDPAGDDDFLLPLDNGERVDLLHAEFLPDERDLNVHLQVGDLDGSRSGIANASRFSLEGAVSGESLNVRVFEIAGAWMATVDLGGRTSVASVTTDLLADTITVGIPGVLLDDVPRYLVVDVLSVEGVGVVTPVGPVFVPLFASDWAYARQDLGDPYRTAIDLDAPCPWAGT